MRSSRLPFATSLRAAVLLALLVGTARLGQAQALRGPLAVPPDSLAPAFVEVADPTSPESTLRPWRVATITGLSAGAGLAVLEVQRRRWWADRNPRFRIMHDWEYVRWADKLGHVYSTSFFTRFYRSAFRWAGLSENQAALWGAGAAWTQMLYYEILDGFGPQWGFSPGDVAFNTVGMGLTTAQHFVPELNAFTLKASYWPSGWEGKNFTDDYAGQTFWLTANLHALSPQSAKPYLPDWLNVTVGYAARELGEHDFLTESHVYVGLDIEPTILPLRGKAWETVAGWLRYVHFPAPAIRLTPEPRLVLLAY